MNKSFVAILILLLLLITSNAWWAYTAINVGVTGAYRATSLHEHHEALAQALAVLPVVARPDTTRTDILAAARKAATAPAEFEKDGFSWVGQLGFRFDPAGRLVAVQPAWSPF